ncbi:hypothetical protein, partial [Streptomyces acidiscabies]|uniref:hypothetical protein n=1 Tax=Streptomyces acidiscabies TaxID=42234 RepID=UPI0038F76E48
MNDLNFWLWVLSGGGKENNPFRVLPENLQKQIRDNELIFVSNEFIKATALSEEIFDDMMREESDADDEDLYDSVDEEVLTETEEESEID